MSVRDVSLVVVHPWLPGARSMDTRNGGDVADTSQLLPV